MRRKATAKKASEWRAQGNGNIDIKAGAGENTPLKPIKPEGRPPNSPTGRGLGKAGAKRLGRLLKRAIQSQEQPAGKGQASVPKTPVRFFKHQIQTGAENASRTNAAETKKATQHISQLILNVVSLCKHRGGISMAELKQTLTAGGYDVTKNNRQVHVVTKRLIDNVTLVQTRNASLRLNNEATERIHVRTSTVKSPKPKGILKQNKAVSKSPKVEEKPQKQAAKTPQTRAKSYKPRGKTNRQAARSHKPKSNSRKPAGKTRKLKGKTRKPAGRSHASRRKKTPKARRKTYKTAGKKRRPYRPARVQKAARKPKRTRRRQPKRNHRTYKTHQKRRISRRRLAKTKARLKLRQQQQYDRRRTYYY